MAEKIPLREVIADELIETGNTELANTIARSDMSDKEVRQYIYSGKGYFGKTMNNQELADMPNFRKILYSEPVINNVKDLDKAFHGSDWEKGDYTQDQLEFIAEENGITVDRLKEIMNNEANLRDRARDLEVSASRKGVQNFVTKMMFPRATEEYLKGGQPTGKTIALDAAENVLYMAPYGLIGSALAKGGRAAKTGIALGSAAVNPAIMEGADVIAYTNKPGEESSVLDNTERADFNPGDVAAGTVVNAIMPYAVLRGAGMAGRKFGLPDVGKRISEIGEGMTPQDLKNKWVKDVDMLKKVQKSPSDYPMQLRDELRTKVAPSNEYKNTLTPENQVILTGEKSTNGLIYEPGRTFNEKLKNYQKKLEQPLSKEQIAQLEKDYENWVPKEQIYESENLKTPWDIAAEEAFYKNYITNKTGDIKYGDQPDKIPYIGFLFRKSDKTRQEEKEAKDLEDEINYLYSKYKLPDYREGK